VAPTGAGKTLAGFLPSLVALAGRGPQTLKATGLHTLYISPLKALAVDIARNLEAPIAEMGLPVRVETRTGDTPAHKRTRQISRPPDILLTTPEQLALLIAHREAAEFFSGLRCVILDELHALVTSKRGDLLSLALARLHRLSPGLAAIGLSATVREPDELRKYLVPQGPLPPSPDARARLRGHAERPDMAAGPGAGPLSRAGEGQGEGGELSGRGSVLTRVDGALDPEPSRPSPQPSPARERGQIALPMADLVTVSGGARADLRMLDLGRALPISGHTAWHSMPAIYELIREHRTTLVFVNTRLQAEYTFQELWRLNEDALPIAIHHGSLDAQQRRRVEAAMAAGQLRAIVCTATLDLGIDWGDVDLVINVGAPKGASRIMQRIGRANHRMDEPSKAYLVPGNRFEMLVARRPSTPSRRPRRTRPTPARVPSTCSPSMCSAWPARTPSIRSTSTTRSSRPRPMRVSPGNPSSRSSITSPPAATRCAPTSVSPRSCAGRTGSGACATPAPPRPTG
jgi:ATP-dependent Lhr-like helicase